MHFYSFPLKNNPVIITVSVYGTKTTSNIFTLLKLTAKNGNFDSLLEVILKDAGILLSHLDPADVLRLLDKCPVGILKKHPFSILVLMRSMFNWRNIPKMMELKE